MSDTCAIVVNLHDGSRQPIRPSVHPLLTLRDGALRTRAWRLLEGDAVRFDNVPVLGNLGDQYTVFVSARRHRDAGFFPIHITAGGTHEVNLMLLHRDAVPRFREARWDILADSAPDLFRLLTAENSALARQQYEELLEHFPSCLACLLNITTAIGRLPLPDNERLLPLFRRIDLRRVEDARIATGVHQDRFFAYAEKTLKEIVGSHAGRGDTAGIFEPADASLHPGADVSWKEARFGEANLQFTFHSSDTCTIDGKECIKVEMDMDYYRDGGSHFFLEVVPNTLSPLFGVPHRTDPAQVYALRWMAARNAAEPETFDPPYTLEPALA